MPAILRIVLAVVLGFIAGSAVNISLVMVSGKIIPPPVGADIATVEGLKTSLHLFQPVHFVFPFLAHALGTATGAFVAALAARAHARVAAFVVGGLFLLGGVANAFMLPAPTWFIAVDLILAYGPAAGLGLWCARRVGPRRGA